MFEFLAKEVASRLIASDDAGAERVLDVIKCSFSPNTELHKELKLAKILQTSATSSREVASRILEEVKRSTQTIDAEKLELEKTALISLIEKNIDKNGALYDAQVEDYKLLSTIGTLTKDWRVFNEENIVRIAKYEEIVVEHLLREPSKIDENSSRMSPGERRLVIATMTRKLEERWGSTLTKSQKELLRQYVLAKDVSALSVAMQSIKENVIECIDAYLEKQDKDSYFANRLEETKIIVAADDFSTVTDQSVSNCMLYLKLVDEITGVEKNV